MDQAKARLDDLEEVYGKGTNKTGIRSRTPKSTRRKAGLPPLAPSSGRKLLMHPPIKTEGKGVNEFYVK